MNASARIQEQARTTRSSEEYRVRVRQGLAKVQERGQVTLPKLIREAAGIKSGDLVVFRVLGPGKVEIETYRPKPMQWWWDNYAYDGPLTVDEMMRLAEDDLMNSGEDG